MSLGYFPKYKSVSQFSHSIASNSLRPHGLQDTRLPVHHQLPEFTQTNVHHISDAIQPSHPLLSPSPTAFNVFRIRVFSNVLVLCIRWPKYWSFSFCISPSNEYSGLISFRMDWLDLLAVQGDFRWRGCFSRQEIQNNSPRSGRCRRAEPMFWASIRPVLVHR